MQDDRGSNVGGEHSPAAPAPDRSGERDPHLSAKSLAARGDALDGSEDGRKGGEEEGGESA